MAKGSKCPSEVVFKILSDEIASFIQPFICHARFPVSLISNIRSIPVPLGAEGSIASIHLPSTISLRPVIKYLFIRLSVRILRCARLLLGRGKLSAYRRRSDRSNAKKTRGILLLFFIYRNFTVFLNVHVQNYSGRDLVHVNVKWISQRNCVSNRLVVTRSDDFIRKLRLINFSACPLPHWYYLLIYERFTSTRSWKSHRKHVRE